MTIHSVPTQPRPLKLKWGSPQFTDRDMVLKVLLGFNSILYPTHPPVTDTDYDILVVEIPLINHGSEHVLHRQVFADCWIRHHAITPAHRNTMFKLIVEKLRSLGHLPTPMEPLL